MNDKISDKVQNKISDKIQDGFLRKLTKKILVVAVGLGILMMSQTGGESTFGGMEGIRGGIGSLLSLGSPETGNPDGGAGDSGGNAGDKDDGASRMTPEAEALALDPVLSDPITHQEDFFLVLRALSAFWIPGELPVLMEQELAGRENAARTVEHLRNYRAVRVKEMVSFQPLETPAAGETGNKQSGEASENGTGVPEIPEAVNLALQRFVAQDKNQEEIIGLLFADNPDLFLQREMRNFTWQLTLRLRVDGDGRLFSKGLGERKNTLD